MTTRAIDYLIHGDEVKIIHPHNKELTFHRFRTLPLFRLQAIFLDGIQEYCLEKINGRWVTHEGNAISTVEYIRNTLISYR
jgi:hypothetical protein